MHAYLPLGMALDDSIWLLITLWYLKCFPRNKWNSQLWFLVSLPIGIMFWMILPLITSGHQALPRLWHMCWESGNFFNIMTGLVATGLFLSYLWHFCYRHFLVVSHWVRGKNAVQSVSFYLSLQLSSTFWEHLSIKSMKDISSYLGVWDPYLFEITQTTYSVKQMVSISAHPIWIVISYLKYS